MDILKNKNYRMVGNFKENKLMIIDNYLNVCLD